MKKWAFLMSSCDSYEDLWEPFFECLDRFGGGKKELSVYLNTEHKQFVPQKELSFEVKTLNQRGNKNLTWSRRFIDVLNRIPEDYVFLVLDDFFACDTIRWDLFDEIVEIMEKDKSIASFQMYGTRTRNRDEENFVLSTELTYKELHDGGWKTHFVPTIWRKEVLLKWLRPWESIWAFEGYGSDRARRWKYPEKVMVVDTMPIYDYLWIKDCSAVINSKWLNEPELFEFMEKNEINVDWSKRGKMTQEEYLAVTMQDVIKKYTFGQIIVKCINRVRSLF